MKVVCSSACSGRGPVGGVVDRRDVPEEEVDRPQRQRHRRVGEDPEAVEDADREDRLQQRPGQPEHEQQGGDVADQQVLGHVGDHQLVGDVTDRREQGDRDHEQAGGEADLAPERHRPAPRREGHRPLRVERRGDRHRDQLQRREGAADVGERKRHGFQRSAGG